MKLVTFEHGGTERVGVLRGDMVVTVDVTDMRTLFELGRRFAQGATCTR